MLGSNRRAIADVLAHGSFLALHTAIHPRAVTEFVYRYSSPKRAFVFISFYLAAAAAKSPPTPATGVSTPVITTQQARQEELSSLMSSLRAGGMKPLDISDNEMAKSHGRYLVGGRSTVPNERIFRFEFPERPGALRKFLETLSPVGFNVSLFHYRNQAGGES